jgi:hypothetical protein
MDKKNYTIDLSHGELVFSIESLHDSIKSNLTSAFVDSWDSWRDNVDYEMFSMVTNGTLMLYGRMLQLYQENEEQLEEWVEQVSFSNGQWNLLDKIDSASGWETLERFKQEEFDEF